MENIYIYVRGRNFLGRDSAKKIDVHGLDVLTLTASTAPLGKKKRGYTGLAFPIRYRFPLRQKQPKR